MSVPTLPGKPDSVRKGLYIEADLASVIEAIAERSSLSFNAAAVQLIALGIDRLEQEQRGAMTCQTSK